MLKPQQSEFLSLEAPVYGKPWFWQRSFSTMESSRSLAHVIMEMRNDIKKLETENRALRGELGQTSFGTEPRKPSPESPAVQHRTGVDVNPYISLRRNVSAPALEGQYKENLMTVRRYSISSNMPTVLRDRGETDRPPEDGDDGTGENSSWGRLYRQVHGNTSTIFGNSSQDEISTTAKGKLTNRRSLQEYVHKNRTKVKTVTFLLPVDDIYTNRPVLANHPTDQNNELDSIAETDS